MGSESGWWGGQEGVCGVETYYFSTHGTDRSGALLVLEVEGTAACAAA